MRKWWNEFMRRSLESRDGGCQPVLAFPVDHVPLCPATDAGVTPESRAYCIIAATDILLRVSELTGMLPSFAQSSSPGTGTGVPLRRV